MSGLNDVQAIPQGRRPFASNAAPGSIPEGSYGEHYYNSQVVHDSANLVEAFHSLQMHNPVPRAPSAVSHMADSIPRVGTSQSNLPPGVAAPTASRQPSLSTNSSLYDSTTDHFFDPYAELGSWLDSSEGRANGRAAHDAGHTHPAGAYGLSDSVSTLQQSFPPTAYHQDYNSLYAAASNVLGMGPPPVQPVGPQPGQYPQGPPPSNFRPPTRQPTVNSISSYGSNQSIPYRMTPEQSPYQPSQVPSFSDDSSSAIDDVEIEMRPRADRATTASLANQKSKAIDLSAPPYTKEYIDQYRLRVKDDPDPEAHFLYAKYLIDAAKKIGARAKDQRSVKKYRDLLVSESLKVIRRLATQGTAYDEAQFFLANCHGTGMLGLQVDHERAYHLYLQAAKQNHPAAAYRVAVCNEIGAGTKREPERAAAFYRKAASLGDTAAMYKLGVILLHGTLGEQKNPRDAVGWLQRAAEQADEENPHALHELALLHSNPTTKVVQYDPVHARELLTRAGHLGYTHSQFRLGQNYEYGTLACPSDPRRSIAWYTKAAEKGHAEAELALSGWYLTGSEGVLKQSDSEAYLWARRAGNRGLSKAEYAVGYYAEVGIGIKQDIEFAKRWYMRAAAQGNKRAMNRLTEMKREGNKRTNMARPTRQQAKDECVIC